MGFLEDFAAQLLGKQAQDAIAKENTYYQLASVPDTAASLFQQAGASGKFKPRDVLVGSLVSGLLGGALKGYGDRYQSDLTDRYTKTAGNLLLGKTDNELNIQPSLFNQAKSSAGLFKLQQGLKNEQDAIDANRQVTANIQAAAAEEALKNPRSADRILAQRDKLLGITPTGIDPAVSTGTPSRSSAVAALPEVKVPAALGATKSTLSTLQNKVDEYINAGYNDSEATALASNDIKNQRDLEVAFAKEISNSQQAKDYGKLTQQLENLNSSLNQSSPSATAAAIYSLAKVLDPASTVREGEFQIFAAPGSPVNAFNSYLSELKGKGKLSQESKDNIRALVPELARAGSTTYKTYANSLLDTLEKQGGNRANITLLGEPAIGNNKVDLGRNTSQGIPKILPGETREQFIARVATR